MPHKKRESPAYIRTFTWRNDPSAGFCFDCDQEGTIIFDKGAGPAARENLRRCLDGSYAVTDDGVLAICREPAITPGTCRRPQPLS